MDGGGGASWTGNRGNDELTHPAHERGEDLQVFGLLGVEEGKRTQQEGEGGLQGAAESSDLILQTELSCQIKAKWKKASSWEPEIKAIINR